MKCRKAIHFFGGNFKAAVVVASDRAAMLAVAFHMDALLAQLCL